MTTSSITELRAKRSRRRNTNMLIGSVLVSLVVLAAVLSFIWTPYNPYEQFFAEKHQGSSLSHLMGTDRLGRDVFSNILYGARITLLVGLVAVGIALLVGTPLGILAGMKRGATEEVTMRFADILLAFPALLMAIMFAAVYGPGTVSAMVAIGIGSIPGFARIARSGTLQVMSTEYVQAARASSQPALRVAWRHVMPNIVGMVVVQSSVTFALAVLAEAALSFLGLGTQPPTASWGRMLQESQQYISINPMLVVWPGLAIAVAVMGFNLLGDGLRDRFDPKLNGERS
ncbi:ABC transporter permease [Paeniglutamicibacter gangotriensis]|uniref:Oligopeptide ABC transporter, oligopeptide-binding protein n=1 Tax=Paeniglutamicibacter gangotriensis Lz1y TaxID=1276920 RepID=M7MW27_9MICC|nr:ABC transporter permease [Paeniglutamicibacter gangotriensis]EMQ99145.1 oligopeptide ABC transporter, oligopeptide-binding protein [Paeniglutamicibacter gangotriensis Lz1y]